MFFSKYSPPLIGKAILVTPKEVKFLFDIYKTVGDGATLLAVENGIKTHLPNGRFTVIGKRWEGDGIVFLTGNRDGDRLYLYGVYKHEQSHFLENLSVTVSEPDITVVNSDYSHNKYSFHKMSPIEIKTEYSQMVSRALKKLERKEGWKERFYIDKDRDALLIISSNPSFL